MQSLCENRPWSISVLGLPAFFFPVPKGKTERQKKGTERDADGTESRKGDRKDRKETERTERTKTAPKVSRTFGHVSVLSVTFPSFRSPFRPFGHLSGSCVLFTRHENTK